MNALTMSPPSPAKVLLVDDQDMVRMGLKAIMAAEGDPAPAPIHWLEARNLADAMDAVDHEANVDLVLLDLNMGDCKGLQGLSQMLARHPLTRVAVMSGTQDDFVVGQARSMGALGFLPKSASSECTRTQVRALIDACKAGARQGSPGLFPTSPGYDRIADLGPRHLEVLELVLSGLSNHEIASETHLSLGTVKNYVSTILQALDVKSRSHLITLFQ